MVTIIMRFCNGFRQVPNNQQIYPLLNLEVKSWTALCFAAMKGQVNICQVRLIFHTLVNGIRILACVQTPPSLQKKIEERDVCKSPSLIMFRYTLT